MDWTWQSHQKELCAHVQYDLEPAQEDAQEFEQIPTGREGRGLCIGVLLCFKFSWYDFSPMWLIWNMYAKWYVLWSLSNYYDSILLSFGWGCHTVRCFGPRSHFASSKHGEGTWKPALCLRPLNRIFEIIFPLSFWPAPKSWHLPDTQP